MSEKLQMPIIIRGLVGGFIKETIIILITNPQSEISNPQSQEFPCPKNPSSSLAAESPACPPAATPV
jgi:hypothetical protein